MRAYLLTLPQLVDVAAQEMHRDPDTLDPRFDLNAWNLDRIAADGCWSLGTGRYESVHYVGEIDHRPVLTISHGPGRTGLPPNAASAGYLGWLITGLYEAHALAPEEVARYLARCPGIGWPRTELTRLASSVLDEAPAPHPSARHRFPAQATGAASA